MTDRHDDDPNAQLAEAIHADARRDVPKPTLREEIQELRAFDVPFEAIENRLRCEYDAGEIGVRTLGPRSPTIPAVVKQLEDGDAIGVGIIPAGWSAYVVSGRVEVPTDLGETLGVCVDTSGWELLAEGRSPFDPGGVALERDGAEVLARQVDTGQELGRVMKLKTGAIVDPTEFFSEGDREVSL